MRILIVGCTRFYLICYSRRLIAEGQECVAVSRCRAAVMWSISEEAHQLIPIWNRWAGDHQPEDSQHGCERRKPEGETPSEETHGRQVRAFVGIHTTGSQKAQ
ncbi:hypothetical protein ACVWXO_006175 [Bradyrhizobium sp. LM2.7]